VLNSSVNIFIFFYQFIPLFLLGNGAKQHQLVLLPDEGRLQDWVILCDVGRLQKLVLIRDATKPLAQDYSVMDIFMFSSYQWL